MTAISFDTNDKYQGNNAGAIAGRYNDSDLEFKKTSFNGASTLFPGGICAQPREQQ